MTSLSAPVERALARDDLLMVARDAAVAALLHTVDGAIVPRDLTADVTTTYRRIRDLRLSGAHQAALDLADLPDEHFFGTGAEPFRAHYQYEVGAALLRLGQAGQVDA